MSGHMYIFDAIKRKAFAPLYLFCGEEAFIKKQALAQLTAALIPEGVRDINYHPMEGAGLESSDILAACETLPFMNDKRLVVVKDYQGLDEKKTGEDAGLIQYLPRIPDTTCLVFYSRGEVSKTRALYTAIRKHGTIIAFERLEAPELRKWTAARLKKLGKTMAPADLMHFLMLTGSHLEGVDLELQKLAAYTGAETVIKREALETVVSPLPEHTVFQLVDAVSAHDPAKALGLLDVLLQNGQTIQRIISLLARQLKVMLLCKDYEVQGLAHPRIMEILTAPPLKIHPYAFKKSMEFQRGFTREQLRGGLRACLQLDFAIKRGRAKERLGMERMLIQLCSLNMVSE